MEFIRSLESEVLKIKGSLIIWISVLGGLLIPLVFAARFIYIESHINLTHVTGAWEQLFSQNSRAFLGFLAPVGIMLICSLITQIEYSNNNWKQVHTTPQKYSTIFFAKLTTLMFLAVFVFLLLNLGILLHGILPCLIIDGRFPKHPIPFAHFFFQSSKCFILALPIIGFQYLLSLHFKNFMVALGVGLTAYVGSMPAIKIESIAILTPYGYVLQYFDQKIMYYHYGYAILYFVILISISYILYLRKSDKT